MRKSNVALRLQESLLDEARRVAETEGVALNQFINVAVAEKLSALRTEDYFRERAARGQRCESQAFAETRWGGNPACARRRTQLTITPPDPARATRDSAGSRHI